MDGPLSTFLTGYCQACHPRLLAPPVRDKPPTMIRHLPYLTGYCRATPRVRGKPPTICRTSLATGRERQQRQ